MKESRSRARLGAHMSISGGLHRAIDRAERIDATALQIFVRNARQWGAKPLAQPEIEKFRCRLEESGLGPFTLAHSGYLMNVASPDPALWKRSVADLRLELERCALLGIKYLVFHPGSHVGSGEEAGVAKVAKALDRLAPAHGRESGVMLLIETTAGQGSNLGHRFEQITRIMDRARCGESLGVCFDTCHAYAAGYELGDRKNFRRVFDRFDQLMGIGSLRAFHLNDSKNPKGSRKDRHQHIGQGDVGLEAFRLLLNDRRFHDLPMVLETPKGEDLAEDRENLSILRALIPRSRR
jgi:deoxyribonuclease-4